MKKTHLILVLCLILGTTVAYAQVALKPALGFNISDVSKDPATGEAKGKAGWQIGASALIGKKFYIEPGLFFMHNSTEFTSSSSNNDDFEAQLKGIRIPVALGLHLLGNEESPVDIRVFGGPSLFMVTSVDAEPLTKDDFESPQWGVFAGAGIDFLIFFVDLKYEWSLTDVSGVTDFDVGKRRSFFTNAGVRLRF